VSPAGVAPFADSTLGSDHLRLVDSTEEAWQMHDIKNTWTVCLLDVPVSTLLVAGASIFLQGSLG